MEHYNQINIFIQINRMLMLKYYSRLYVRTININNFKI